MRKAKAPRPKSAAIGMSKYRVLDTPYKRDNPRYVHEPELFRSIKFDKSAVYFRDNKVNTCAYIQKKNGGQGQSAAIAFPLEKTGWKHPSSYQNLN